MLKGMTWFEVAVRTLHLGDPRHIWDISKDVPRRHTIQFSRTEPRYAVHVSRGLLTSLTFRFAFSRQRGGDFSCFSQLVNRFFLRLLFFSFCPATLFLLFREEPGSEESEAAEGSAYFVLVSNQSRGPE